MIKKILLAVAVLIVGFVAFASTRPDTFRYERSGVINARPEKIFPYLRDFRLGNQWSPYDKIDPHMKKTFSGPESGTGSVMEFEGNSDVGSGRLEILKEEPNSLVQIRLEMMKPMKGTNIVEYRLTPVGSQTRFTWSMSGNCGLLGKIVGLLIDCEKMVGDEFSKGIVNLKTLMESKV